MPIVAKVSTKLCTNFASEKHKAVKITRNDSGMSFLVHMGIWIAGNNVGPTRGPMCWHWVIAILLVNSAKMIQPPLSLSEIQQRFIV